MRVVAVVQARVGSARLPGKALRALHGRPMLAHVIERVRQTPGVDEVVVATSLEEGDTAVENVARDAGCRAWRGSLHDVSRRLRDAAVWARADVVLRATGDCPLFCADVAARVLSTYLQQPAPRRYVWNDTFMSGYPDGTDVEVFGMDLLRFGAATDADREHVTPAMRRCGTCGGRGVRPMRGVCARCRGTGRGYADQVIVVHAPVNLTRLKLSVDRLPDFETVQRVYQHLAPAEPATFANLCRAVVAAGLANSEEVAACL